MIHNRLSKAKKRDEVLILVEEIITALDMVAQTTIKAESCSMPVDIQRALRSAKRLQRLLHENVFAEINWQSLGRAIAYLADLAAKIHSLLNCLFLIFIYYEIWINCKTSKSNRWIISNRLGQGFGYSPNLSVSNRERKSRTGINLFKSCF